MILKRCNMKSFDNICDGKKLVCYGIGGEFERIVENYSDYKWIDSIVYLVDGNDTKRGTEKIVNGIEHTILSLDEFLKRELSNIIILITCTAFEEVIEKLNKISQLDKIECYPFHFMYNLSENEQIKIRQTDTALIPPIIHYCWFGKGDKSDLYKKCIDSWHKYCPKYQIKEWNETNCDVSETVYTKQAYDAGKYGFVSDYFRLKIIYENGGIYLDTDVELLRSLDDLRYNEAFCGMQFPGEVASGLGFGAVKNNKVVYYLMRRYKKMKFIKENGSLNEVPCPIYLTEDLRKIGMKHGPGFQRIEGLSIYPIEVLSPKNPSTGEYLPTLNSYTIHHYDGSWVDKELQSENVERMRKKKRIKDMFS